MILRLLSLFTIVSMLSNASSAFAADKTWTLQDAYAAALGTTELVKIAEENVLQSEFRIDQAWTYLYPRLNARGAYTRFNDTLPEGGGPMIFQPTDSYQASLVLTQPLYTGGRTLAALRTAKKMRESSTSALSQSKQDMLIKVADAYYGALKAGKMVDINKRSLERMERHQKVTEREAATRRTKANQSALLRAKSLVSQSRISLLRAQDGLKIARERLSVLTSIAPEDALVEPSTLAPGSESLADFQKTALLNREDYISSLTNKSIAEENITIVKGSHYPQIYAEAGLTYQESRPATALDATSYYGGVRIQVPIFEGGLQKAEVSVARSKVRQAELTSNLLRKSIESDVYEAYINVQTVSSVMETASLQMDYAKGSFDAAESLFSEGLLPSLSLIDAEQALTFAERELMSAQYDLQISILRLKKIIGTLGKES